MLLYIKDHCEEYMGQSSIEESLGLVTDFGVLPNGFQDCSCVAHKRCQGQEKNQVLYVRLIDEFATEQQLFLTVCLRGLSCKGRVKTEKYNYSTAL